MVGLFTSGVLACGVTDDSKLPPNVQDPTTLRTPSGALARYRGALAELSSAFDKAMTVGGVLTDELAALPIPLSTVGPYTGLDSRIDPQATIAFNRLHRLRAQAREARGFLGAYAPDSSPALRGHLYALEGYAELYLADLFCSGIPLSTVDFDGNYTAVAGSSTGDVYRHAAALFDTARTLTSDSVHLQHLAAVGRGRVLLALDSMSAAAAVVAVVPDDYQYQILFPWDVLNGARTEEPDSAALFWFAIQTTPASRIGAPSMGNQEGGVGLDYRTSTDPRTLPWTRNVADPSGNRLYFPRKYTPNGSATGLPTSPISFRVASGIEARLIEAEAALQAGDPVTWLAKLNQPRQSLVTCGAIVPATTCPLSMLEDPGAALTDPAAAMAARVDLLFRERAFWLYLTAHRQGDLRRLVRLYQRAPDAVYPTALYPGNTGQYGSEIVVPVPETERELNPNYIGCFHRNA